MDVLRAAALCRPNIQHWHALRSCSVLTQRVVRNPWPGGSLNVSKGVEPQPLLLALTCSVPVVGGWHTHTVSSMAVHTVSGTAANTVSGTAAQMVSCTAACTASGTATHIVSGTHIWYSRCWRACPQHPCLARPACSGCQYPRTARARRLCKSAWVCLRVWLPVWCVCVGRHARTWPALPA